MASIEFSAPLLAVVSVLTIILISYVRRWIFQSKYNLPPGPPCWPVVGYLPYPHIKTHNELRKLAKKYGGLFGLYVGNQYVVVLDDFQAVKACYNKEAFNNRPPSSTQIAASQPSLIDMNNPGWRVQHKFQINSFRLLGAFTKEFEQFVVANATEAINQLKKTTGKDVNTQHSVEHALNNVTFRLLYGRSFEPNHPLIRLLTDFDNAVVHVWGIQTLTVFIPWLLNLYEYTPSLKQARKVIAAMDAIVLKEIKEHRQTMVEEEPRDYIDHYLQEMGKPGADPSYTMQNLIGNVKVLLEASSETTNISLCWFLLSMAKFQTIQEKVYKEIHNVLGSDMEPKYSDRHKLPYTRATLQESMRWKNLLHLNVYRQCSEDSEVCGFDIPKGTIIIQNLTSVFKDPKLWERPEEFDPTRFLSKDGKTVETPEYFIPFSYGTRMCPGDKTAKISLFIFTVSVIQRFRIFPSKAGVNLKENAIFNNHPVHPYVRMELR